MGSGPSDTILSLVLVLSFHCSWWQMSFCLCADVFSLAYWTLFSLLPCVHSLIYDGKAEVFLLLIASSLCCCCFECRAYWQHFIKAPLKLEPRYHSFLATSSLLCTHVWHGMRISKIFCLKFSFCRLVLLWLHWLFMFLLKIGVMVEL